VGSDSNNGVRHQRALSPRLSMMMMNRSLKPASPELYVRIGIFVVSPGLAAIFAAAAAYQKILAAGGWDPAKSAA